MMDHRSFVVGKCAKNGGLFVIKSKTKCSERQRMKVNLPIAQTPLAKSNANVICSKSKKGGKYRGRRRFKKPWKRGDGYQHG